MKTFGQTIKDLRLKRKLSLRQCAVDCGISKTHVWELETARTRNPSIDTLGRLSIVLQTDVRSLAVLAAEEWVRDNPPVPVTHFVAPSKKDANHA